MTRPPSDPLHPPPGQPRPFPPAVRADHDGGAQLLARFSALIRVGRSYRPDNLVFGRQLQGFLEQLRPVLRQNGEAVLVALERDLYLNGVRIPLRSRNVRFHQHVLSEFQRREIAGIRIRQGVTRAEFVQFFRLFLEPQAHRGIELLTACLAQGTDHVLPAIHASTETPDDLAPESASQAYAEEASGPRTTGSGEGDQARGGNRGPALSGLSAPRGAAPKSYSLAIESARSLLAAASLQDGMELRHAKRVVQPLVDGALAQEPVVVGLSSLAHDAYAHAVNVCLVSVSIGHFLEMDRRALADLGVAALLHDLGKATVADQIRHPLKRFTREERALAERHPLEGAKRLAGSTTLDQTTLRCMRVALEHHAGPGTDAYPALGNEWQTSLLSRIVAVADCYVSLQSHRSPRGASITPHQALGMMLGSLRARFHPAMLWALVQTVGFYPAGQLVELDDGSLAVVLAPNAKDPARPHLRLLCSPAREPLRPEDAVELRPLPPDRSVRRALRGEEYPGRADSQAAA